MVKTLPLGSRQRHEAGHVFGKLRRRPLEEERCRATRVTLVRRRQVAIETRIRPVWQASCEQSRDSERTDQTTESSCNAQLENYVDVR